MTIIVKKKETTRCSNPWDAFAGDPVSTATGEYVSEESMDLNLGGPLPLYFARYYASRLAIDDRIDGHLGKNRTHNFSSEMVETAFNRRDVILPGGRVVTFQKTGSVWKLIGPLDVPYQLAESGSNFVFGHPHSQQIWTYNAQGQLLSIADGRGNTLTLSYNGSGELITVSDGIGRSLNLAYSGGKITSVTDHTARQVTFTYAGGLLTTSTNPLGDVTTYNYSGDFLTSVMWPETNVPFTQAFTGEQVTSQTERGTDTSTMGYAPDVTTLTDPTSATLVDTYDANRKLVSHADEAGKQITMGYDSAGRRSLVTDRLGDSTSTVYHAGSGLPATITNAEGKKTSMLYKPRKVSGITFYDLIKTTFPDGGSRSFKYDSKGSIIQITDEAGKNWKFTRNGLGQVLTTTNPLGGVSTNTYDAAGNLTSSQDPDTGVTTYGYDPLNRLTQITHPDASMVVIAYDANDRVTSVTDERSNTYVCGYDANDRLTTITDPASKTTTLGYDVLNRVEQITDRLSATSSFTFDSRRLLSTVTDRNGNAISFQYDSRLRPVSTTDADGKVWIRGYDDEGLLTSSATPIDPPSKIRRNHLGRVVETSNPLGHTVHLTRDPMQRVTQFFDPLGRATTFKYDKRGLLTSASEQGTGTGSYQYDSLGRLSRITDANGAIWRYSSTKGGRPASMTDPLGRTWTHSYDNRGRLAQTNYPDGATVAFSYDDAGNLIERLFSDATDIHYTYDALNRLASTDGATFTYDDEGRLTNAAQNGSDFTATYDPGGRLLTVSYLGGALTVAYQYDTRNRLIQVLDNVSGAQLDFDYDEAGRLTTLTRSNGVNGDYQFDAAGRLTGLEEGAIIDLQYHLNPAGEIVGVDFTAPVVPTPVVASENFKFGKASELIGPGIAYDPRGRLTLYPGSSYGWDDAGRLTNANGVVLAYNGLNDVILRTDGAAVTRFYHHYALGLAPIVYEEPVAGGGAERAYVWTPDGQLLYSVDMASHQPTFYHFDRTGSTIALTDSAGTVTDAYAYGPFGEPLGRSGTSTQPFAYVGAFGVRAEGPLYHMRARYYDPTTARFLSRDPLPPRLGDPKSLSPYQYAAQNPLAYIDPLGNWEFSLSGSSVGESDWANCHRFGRSWGATSAPAYPSSDVCTPVDPGCTFSAHDSRFLVNPLGGCCSADPSSICKPAGFGGTCAASLGCLPTSTASRCDQPGTFSVGFDPVQLDSCSRFLDGGCRPTLPVWAGQRFYRRADVHLVDYFYSDSWGSGAKLATAWFAASALPSQNNAAPCNEVEDLLSKSLSAGREVQNRLHSRFSQNFWKNFGGFGGQITPSPPIDSCYGGMANPSGSTVFPPPAFHPY